MTEDQTQALINVEAMIGEVLDGLKIAAERATDDPPLSGMLRALARVADLAGFEVDIASGASVR